MDGIKYIHIIFPNGEKWRINAYPIAKESAEFNVKVNKLDTNFDHEQYDIEVHDDIDFLLSPEGFDDLLDYMTNYTSWDELDKVKIKTEGFPDYDQWLLSGNFIARGVSE